MLKTSRGVGNVCAADKLTQQLAVRAHVNLEIYAGLDVSNTVDCSNLFNAGVVENTRRRFVATRFLVAAAVFITARRSIESGESSEPAAVYKNLVEQIERFETREHVALQAETKRNHRYDHRHADNHTHGRQRRPQFRLPQISKREMKYV